MNTRTCAACHTPLPAEQVLCVAGPAGAAWYCRDNEACTGRANPTNSPVAATPDPAATGRREADLDPNEVGR